MTFENFKGMFRMTFHINFEQVFGNSGKNTFSVRQPLGQIFAVNVNSTKKKTQNNQPETKLSELFPPKRTKDPLLLFHAEVETRTGTAAGVATKNGLKNKL